MLFVVILGMLAPLQGSAQTTEPLRGMYINGFTLFQGHDRAEQEFVDFVRDNEITYVLFYLRPSDVTALGPKLSELITTLRSEAGVLQVGATTGGGSQVIVDHNNQYSGKFDVINLELEYWQEPQGSQERVESLAHFTGNLDTMNELAAGNDLKVEAYIGWVTKPEMAEIVARLDRLLVHTYVPTPEGAYGYGRTRFEMLSELNSDVEVMPIYSLEKTEANREGGPVFMGQWMLDNSPNKSDHDFNAGFDLTESIFLDDYNAAVAGPTNLDINLVGQHYFVYSEIMNLPPVASIANPALKHIVVEGGASTPIEFVVNGSDNKNLQGVEWYQSGSGHIGTFQFNDETTNSLTIDAVPPYSVSAVPFDSGLYGRPALYAKDAATWEVLAQNTLPTVTAASPENLEIYLEPGTTQTFIHTVEDIDGNLFAADWYGQGEYLRRSIISGNSATTSRDIQFNEVGTFTVAVDLFDRAVYMPANEIRQNKIGSSVRWTVHVGIEPEPQEPAPVPTDTGTPTDTDIPTNGGNPDPTDIDIPTNGGNPSPTDTSIPTNGGNPSPTDTSIPTNGGNPTDSESEGETGATDGPELTGLDETFRSNSHANYDRDQDGVPAYLDDNDYDGEIGNDDNSIEPYFDPDGDGTLSFTGSTEEIRDTDGDLVPDTIEIANGTDPADPLSFNDFDNDQLPDYIDPDDDNDRIPDFIEGDADMDGDGIPNRFDLDSDGDGASDATEGAADVDGNNIPNFVDNGTVSAIPLSDQDNDGIADDLEGLDDLDQDGIANYLDDDSDGDGIPDLDETNADHDADGIPNYLDTDSDGDLISDLIEGNVDTDFDGMSDFLDTIVDPITETDVDIGTENTSGSDAERSSEILRVGTGGGAFGSVLSLFVTIACLASRRRRIPVSRK